jgi:hypothetical protein
VEARTTAWVKAGVWSLTPLRFGRGRLIGQFVSNNYIAYRKFVLMENLQEKRRLIHDWIDVAGEEEVDLILSKILGKDSDPYRQKLAEELYGRRQKHLDGTSESFTRDNVQLKIDDIRRKYAS